MEVGVPNADFLKGGGEMGSLTRSFNWASTTLGPPETWPQSLRVTVRLLLASRQPMFIWWGPDLIQFYNDAYSETMGPERHPGALGGFGRDWWLEIWSIIGPQIDYVMLGLGSTWDEDRLIPVTRNGRREDVWWTYGYSAIDFEGGVGGVLVVCNDVTKEHLAVEALRNQTMRLEQLFEQAPGFTAVLRGPNHVFEMTNSAYRKLIGPRDYLGRSVRDVIPEVEGQGFFELLDEAYRSGNAHIGTRVPLRVTVDEGTEETFLDFLYQPIFNVDGSVSGVFVQGIDVTEHVKSEARLRLLNGELKHRVKNSLAMVSAIASQTLRGTGRDDALRAFQARLGAFASAHDILTEHAWATIDIGVAVENAIAPHRDGDKRINASGPPVTLGAKQCLSLALALHELATNAAKYGALSNEKGHVTITWDVAATTDGPVFRFNWVEADGPAVEIPNSRGFGSRLIERLLQADLGASPKLTYWPDGVICTLETPVNRLDNALSSPFGNNDAETGAPP
jgi:two-component sensor histidine kinase